MYLGDESLMSASLYGKVSDRAGQDMHKRHVLTGDI
jgi:hypothetical protein